MDKNPPEMHFLRHGVTDWNVEHRMTSVSDIPLNREGIAQTKILSERIRDLQLNTIITSPMKRAIVTGEIIAANQRSTLQNVIIDPLLQELDFGTFEGRSKNDILKSDVAPLYQEWRNGLELPSSMEVETWDNLKIRARSLLSKYMLHDGPILFISHGYFIRVLFRTIIKGEPISSITSYPLDNGKFATIRWTNRHPNILEFNHDLEMCPI